MNTNELLRSQRLSLGLTLDEAAKLVELQPMSVWRHENENRTLSLPIAARYAKAYNLTLEQLACRSPAPAQPQDGAA